MSRDRIAQAQVIAFKIVESQLYFLLLKRMPERGSFWQAVTGGVEEGEDFLEAAKRELEEETGLNQVIEWFEGLHYFEFESIGFGPLKEYVFGAQVSPEAEAVISDEHSEMKWCTLNEALSLLKYESNREGFRKVAEMVRKNPLKLS